MARWMIVCVLMGLGMVGGCAHTPAVTATNDAAMLLGSPAARRVMVFDGRAGTPVAWASLVEAASGAEVVFIGENHGHPLGLAAADALWEDAIARSPKAALAMEFFERDQQAAIDDYLSGVVDEATFRKLASHTSEGTYPPGHRAMVEAARAKGRPVIAANSPRRYVRAARESGFERLSSLGAEQKRLFRVPDSLPGPETRYRREFDKVMSPTPGHGAATPSAPEDQERATRLDATFRSQSVWDWTMGESVVRSVEAGNAPTFLVVGRFHVDFEGGTVRAVGLLRPGTRAVTVSFVDARSDSLRSEDAGRADFVVYVGSGAGG